MPNREAGRLIHEDYGMIQWLNYILGDRVIPKTQNVTKGDNPLKDDRRISILEKLFLYKL